MNQGQEQAGVFSMFGRMIDESVAMAADLASGKLTRSEYDGWMHRRRADYDGMMSAVKERGWMASRPKSARPRHRRRHAGRR